MIQHEQVTPLVERKRLHGAELRIIVLALSSLTSLASWGAVIRDVSP